MRRSCFEQKVVAARLGAKSSVMKRWRVKREVKPFD